MKNRTEELLKGCGKVIYNKEIKLGCGDFGELCPECKSKIQERLRCLEEVKEMIDKVFDFGDDDTLFGLEGECDKCDKNYERLEQLKAEIQAQINRIKEVGK